MWLHGIYCNMFREPARAVHSMAKRTSSRNSSVRIVPIFHLGKQIKYIRILTSSVVPLYVNKGLVSVIMTINYLHLFWEMRLLLLFVFCWANNQCQWRYPDLTTLSECTTWIHFIWFSIHNFTFFVNTSRHFSKGSVIGDTVEGTQKESSGKLLQEEEESYTLMRVHDLGILK